MSTLASNRVVILNETSFNENNDRNWKKHELYNNFTHNLNTDYKHSLNNRQRSHSSYLSALNKSKHSYSLFQVYLKIISQIGETVNHLQFQFKINNNNKRNTKHTFEVKCIVEIYYISGFIQTIVIHNTNKSMQKNNKHKHNINRARIPKHKKQTQTQNMKQINTTLINAVKQQKAYNYNYLPIQIKHNPTKTNALHTDITYPTNYPIQNEMNDNKYEKNNKMEMDNEEEMEIDDEQKYENINAEKQKKKSHMSDQVHEESILWRFYHQKKSFSSIDWPTCMDDTFFRDRPDIVRSDENLQQFTFVNNNPEWNERRGNYLDEWSDVEDNENNDLSINFRSNHPIPNEIFMYYFEVTVKHNNVQSHNAKFKRCYFGLIPQSKIYFPAQNQQSIHESQILQNIILNNSNNNSNNKNNKFGKNKSNDSTNVSNLKLLSSNINMAYNINMNSSSGALDSDKQKKKLQKKKRKRYHINNYLSKIRKNLHKNRNRSDVFVSNANEMSSSDDWFDDYESNDETDASNEEQLHDTKMNNNNNANDIELPSMIDLQNPKLSTINDNNSMITSKYKRKKKERKEKEIFKDKCIKSMREYDKLFYNLWCDENIIYSSDDQTVCDNNNNNNNIHSNEACDENNKMELLQSALINKWEPSQTAKDTFVSEVFENKQITNNSICVKVHSNIFTVSKKFIYNDQYYNHIHQDSIWKKKNNNNKTKKNNNMNEEEEEEDDDDDDDENESDEKDVIGVDGWERIDDETFYLTKPENFEKRIYLTSVNNNNNNKKKKKNKRRTQKRNYLSDESDEYGNNINHENGVVHNGNVLINGLDAFVGDTDELKNRDIEYNNAMYVNKNNNDETAVNNRWQKTDEAVIKRQKKSRYNKQVEIVKKFARPIENGDTIGIGINFHQRTLFVTVNGELISDKKYNKYMIFRDIFINEPLYIFGILKHFGNQLSFNFGQRKFKFDLQRYFSVEYVRMIQRNNNYMNRFKLNEAHGMNNINKKLLDNMVLDHCIYEGYEVTAKKLICKIFGHENGNKLITHLSICNDVFNSMNIRRCIKKCMESGAMERVKCNIKKLKISYFSMKYPVAWFQILRQELIELLRNNETTQAKHLYETELLGFESFLLSDFNPHRLNLDDKNKKILQNEMNILGTLLINCIHNQCFDINNILIEYRYLFDVNRRYRLRDIIHNLIYQHMKERENKRINCLYDICSASDNTKTLKIYDSQLNLFLRHLCTVYDCYKTNFANYLESIRFV